MHKSARYLLMAALVAACLVFTAGLAPAADAKLPDKPLMLVVPFGTGGGTDLSARLFAPELQQELGVPVQVINKPGGGGWVAWHEMANWPAEEWSIGYVNLPHIFSYLNPKMQRTETIDSWNFLFMDTIDPGLIVVRADDERFTDLKSFLDYASKNSVVVAAHGVGGDDFIGVKQVQKAFPDVKIKMLHNDSDSKSISQLVGGHVDAVFGNVAKYTTQILEGKFRALCVNWYERVEFLPSVPTFEEVTGKKVIHYAARIVAAPNGMPAERQQAIIAASERAMNHPEYKLKMMSSRLSMNMLTGEKLKAFLQESKDMVAGLAYWEE